MQKLEWSDKDLRWTTTVSVDGGKDSEYINSYQITSDFVISAIGQLCKPKGWNIPGLDSFKGKVMHTARWDRGYELAGKKVAILGTGMPLLVRSRESLTTPRSYKRSNCAEDRTCRRTLDSLPTDSTICDSAP